MAVDVEIFIQDHDRIIDTIDGLEVHIEQGLIAMLREAIYGGAIPDGMRRGFEPKLPIQSSAYDKYREIDGWITEAWVDAFQQVPNADRPEALLAQWAAHSSDDTWVASQNMTARNFMRKIEAEIRTYFDPPRLAEIDAPCLLCHVRWVTRKQDGQYVRSSALSFRRDRRTGETLDAECAACQSVWYPDKFEWLARQLGILQDA